MKQICRCLTALLFLSLTGCFQVATVIQVNPDGSGTVRETVLLSRKMVEQMEGAFSAMPGGEEAKPADGGEAKPAPFDLFDPAKLREQAKSMGEGVSYRSGSKVTNPDFTGYTASFDFTDINRLRLHQQGAAASSPGGGAASASLPLSFEFRKGSPSSLTISQPAVAKAAPDGPAKQAEQPPAAAATDSGPDAAMMAEMFRGLRFEVGIEINGAIVSTDAAHRDGNRLTMFELDLAKLTDSGPVLQRLASLQGKSIAETQALLMDLPGLKIDPKEKIAVSFK